MHCRERQLLTYRSLEQKPMNPKSPKIFDERSDQFNLARFVSAQEGSYDVALAEVTRGRKYSHWMWFIFPQLRGLGRSSTAQFYGIGGTEEARAYLDHPLLGPRLIAVCQAALAVEGRSALEIFGSPDDMKLRSCATLFAQISSPDSVFHKLLDKYYGGQPDARTLELLGEG
jgi:uncharacterized protein (DUF1810 family)